MEIAVGTCNPLTLTLEEKASVGISLRAHHRRKNHPIVQLHAQAEITYSQLLVYLFNDLVQEGAFGRIDHEPKNRFTKATINDELFQDLHYRINDTQQKLSPFECPDLLEENSLPDDHPLVKAYVLEKPAKGKKRIRFCITSARSLVHYGKMWHYGGAPFPVESFRKETAKEIGCIPDHFEATEFGYDLILRLVRSSLPDLAEKVYFSYPGTIGLLKYGKRGFKFYESFKHQNCPGCVTSPSKCDFMEGRRYKVAEGWYNLQSCPARINGCLVIGGRES